VFRGQLLTFGGTLLAQGLFGGFSVGGFFGFGFGFSLGFGFGFGFGLGFGVGFGFGFGFGLGLGICLGFGLGIGFALALASASALALASASGSTAGAAAAASVPPFLQRPCLRAWQPVGRGRLGGGLGCGAALAGAAFFSSSMVRSGSGARAARSTETPSSRLAMGAMSAALPPSMARSMKGLDQPDGFGVAHDQDVGAGHEVGHGADGFHQDAAFFRITQGRCFVTPCLASLHFQISLPRLLMMGIWSLSSPWAMAAILRRSMTE
jgi:hypothetical protein